MKIPEKLIQMALREDFGARGDVTTRYFVRRGARLSGRVVAKQDGVICGAEIAAAVFRAAAPGCRARVLVPDGRRARKGQTVLRVSGGPSLLSAERTALNFIQHLSGVATLTALFADRVKGTRAKIYDTRKTLPGWRALQKYAVLCGGGRNHRMGLYDAVLLKDNHWSCARDMGRAIAALRRAHPRMTLEIEAATLDQVRRTLEAGADVILLDNMGRSLLGRAIALIRAESSRVQIEVSGGVTLKTARALARLGPDRISIGRITHSAPALDLSLEIP